MPNLVGERLDRYEIVSHLGAGGMGEVYRGRDLQLDRDVAVKVLADGAADDPARVKRFEREARAVARLSHPNILDIHDFGTDHGIVYAVTELLQGHDLAEILHRSRLPLARALQIGRAVAEGLAAAHGAGVIHRDLKPANVFVTTDGQVRILDFGIARLREEDDEADRPRTADSTDSLTGVGRVAGTVGYMSPEQVEGRPVDARSDIFSLGCVLYEMLTGQRAFRGESASDTMLAVLGRDPQPIAELRDDVPPALETVIRRCLEKQPGERFESARDVAFALQALSDARDTPSAVRAARLRPRRRRLAAAAIFAVLLGIVAVVVGRAVFAPPLPLPGTLYVGVVPFTSVGDDRWTGEFAAGLTDVLTEELALLEQQEGGIGWVAPSAAAAEFKVSSVRDFGRSLGVTVAVVGEVAHAASGIRLELSLVDPAAGRILRSSVIEEEPSNVESFQREPLLQLAELLSVAPSDRTLDRLSSGSTTMASAFDAWLRGRGRLARADDPAEVEAAVSLFEAAIRDDPMFANGHLDLARAALAMNARTGAAEWIDSGLASASRAAELGAPVDTVDATVAALQAAAGRSGDASSACEAILARRPGDAEACSQCGLVFQRLERSGDAETAFRRSIFLRPDYWPVHDRLGKLYAALGRYEDAAVQFRQIVRCAPDYALGYVKLGVVTFYLERIDEARRLFERSLEIEPTYYGLSHLGTIYFETSRFADAATMYERALDLDAHDYWVWGNLAYAYRFGSAPDKAEAAFRRAVELAETRIREDPGDLVAETACAGYHAMLGNRERGLELIRTVVGSNPTDPLQVAQIAETFEDLADRAQALEWVERAFAAGIPRSRFEGRPTLRNLVADERYQALVKELADTH